MDYEQVNLLFQKLSGLIDQSGIANEDKSALMAKNAIDSGDERIYSSAFFSIAGSLFDTLLHFDEAEYFLEAALRMNQEDNLLDEEDLILK